MKTVVNIKQLVGELNIHTSGDITQEQLVEIQKLIEDALLKAISAINPHSLKITTREVEPEKQQHNGASREIDSVQKRYINEIVYELEAYKRRGKSTSLISITNVLMKLQIYTNSQNQIHKENEERFEKVCEAIDIMTHGGHAIL